MRKCLLWGACAVLPLAMIWSCSDDASNEPSHDAAGQSNGGEPGSGGSIGGASAGKGGSVSLDPGTSDEGGASGSTQATGGAPNAAGGAPDAGASGSELGGAAGAFTGGAGNVDAGAAGAAGAPPEIPSCDDGKAETADQYNPLYGCAHLTDAAAGGGDGWFWYDAGFYVDERTGNAWTPITSQGSLTEAQSICATLEIGSLSDWRVPTIDEVRASFADGCAATAPTGSCPIHDPDHLASAEIYTQACESCAGSATSAYCPVNAPFCSWIKTSSVCSDCVGQQGWTYGPGNGNFAAIDLTSGLGVSCVIPSLPGGLP
jgi:hypothetical protein